MLHVFRLLLARAQVMDAGHDAPVELLVVRDFLEHPSIGRLIIVMVVVAHLSIPPIMPLSCSWARWSLVRTVDGRTSRTLAICSQLMFSS